MICPLPSSPQNLTCTGYWVDDYNYDYDDVQYRSHCFYSSSRVVYMDGVWTLQSCDLHLCHTIFDCRCW